MTSMTTSGEGEYGGTLHWATARDGFESVITIVNYYGWVFAGQAPDRTDADVNVRFFDEQGTERAPHNAPLPTGRSLHLAVGTVHPGFQGLVAVSMVPRGRMPRRSARPGQPGRPIATSYFMLYERTGGFRDFSHELFLMRRDPDRSATEWATVLYFSDAVNPAIVTMNNRPLGDGFDCRADVALQLLGFDGAPLTAPHMFTLPPGGSALTELATAFPEFDRHRHPRAIITATARNIEQPMSLHLHASGDFNLHHF